MKNIIRISSFSALVLFLSGCFSDPGTDVLLTKEFVSFNVESDQLSEAEGTGTILVEISKAQASDVTVNFSMETNNAVNGADFDLAGTSVTIPAGEYSAEIPFTVNDDDVFQGVSRSFTLTIDNITPAVGIDGNPSITVNILDDDCLYNASAWVATFDAVEDYGTSTYGPYDLELTQDATDPNMFHMDNFYDQGLSAYIVFDPATSTVRFPDQSPVPGFPITNSSGTFKQCTGEATITLTFNGDTFVYRLTKQ